MKTIRTIFIIALALCTVAVSAWTVYTGGKAPDSAKITANTPLVQNATSTAEGIEMLGDVFAKQIGEDMLTEENIVLEREKLDQTVNVHIPAYEAKVAAKEADYNAAKEEIAKLGELKSLNSKQRKQLKEAEGVVADYKATADTLKIYQDNVKIMEDNIAASIEANKNAKIDGENVIALSKAVNYSMIWCYALLAIAVLLIVLSLLNGVIQDPRKLISGGILAVIVLVVVGIAYFIANSHGWNDGVTLKDAAGYDLGIGTDPATRQVFGPFEYMISDISIWVCYIVAGCAILATGFSVIRGFFK